ncbi:MAG: EAL domain-containing protein [Gallionella sp.]
MKLDLSKIIKLSWLHPSHRIAMRKTIVAVALLLLGVIVVTALPLSLSLRGIAHYLPLHTLLETIAVVIAVLIFSVGWNADRFGLARNFLLISCGFLGVGILDFSHMISFVGMPDFVTPSSSEKAIDFWLAARSLAALLLLTVVSTSWRPLVTTTLRYLYLGIVLVLVGLLHWLFLFNVDLMPPTFIAGQGLTPFKIYYEYALVVVSVLTALILWIRMRRPLTFNASGLFGAASAMALSEYLFTLYSDVSDIYNLLGHVLKLVSYLYLYRAIFVAAIENPYIQLRASTSQLQATLDALPDLLFELDAAGRYWNYHSPRTNLLAAPAALLLGKTVQEILPPAAADICMSALREAQETGYSQGKKIELELPTGKYFFELSVSCKSGDAIQGARFIVLSRDISERVKMEMALVESHNLLKAIIDEAPVSIFWKDLDLRYLGCNAAFARDAGGELPEDIIGKDDYQLAWRAQAERYCADDQRVIDTGDAKLSYEETQTRSDGKTIWLSMSKVPLHNAECKTIGMLGLYQNITERKLIDDSLFKLSFAIEQSPVSIIIMDLDARIEYVNSTLSHVSGYSPNEVIGQNLNILQSVKSEQLAYPDMWANLIRGEAWHGELISRRKNGEEYIESVTMSPVRQVDGRITNYVAIKQDITEKKEVEARVERLAHFDQLTGLPNRQLLIDRFQYIHSLAQRNKAPFALLFVNLDRFKDINDALSHSIGDQLLMEIARRIKAVLRVEDTISRLGGDEFLLILPETDADNAAHVASKLVTAVSQPCLIESHHFISTSSIGVAIFPDDGEDFETLSKSANTAMTRVKQEGRNNFRFFTPQMQAHSARSIELANSLRYALLHNELSLHYQPQIAMQGGHIIGAEALLRWHHPLLGKISPAEFIPIAEDSGQIIHIGAWVLRTAVIQLKAWMESGLPPMTIAVNLSAVQFHQANIAGVIMDILDDAGLSSEYLELELTEAVAMNDPKEAIEIMDSLYERGIRMSIDDFGTGYSSLSYLKKFNVYKLKIDQSFVRDISDDPDDKAIVTAIINMASSLGIQTIAEGVETVEQLDFLREHGCDEVQGYFFSKPLPAEQFEVFVKNS